MHYDKQGLCFYIILCKARNYFQSIIKSHFLKLELNEDSENDDVVVTSGDGGDINGAD